jgi:hypothetical protein
MAIKTTTSQTPKSLTGSPARFSQKTGSSRALNPIVAESNHCWRGDKPVGQSDKKAHPGQNPKSNNRKSKTEGIHLNFNLNRNRK